MRPVELPPSVAPSDPDYTRERYSVAQAAVYLGLSAHGVYRLVADRQLGCLRVGESRGRIRISQADLDHYRRTRRQEATSDARRGARHVPPAPLEVPRLPRPKRLHFS
jgi:excisionase family DNA binding protein